MKISKSQLKQIIKEELHAEGIYPATGPVRWPWQKPKRAVEFSDLEKNRQEMKVVGFLERALETLELLGDDREETYGTLRRVRDMIYSDTGLKPDED